MSEKNNNDLINPSIIKKEITSPENIDYLAKKVIENDITGIKYEKKYANGDSESLAIWRQGGKIKQTLTIKEEE
jgi:hypothetical protein